MSVRKWLVAVVAISLRPVGVAEAEFISWVTIGDPGNLPDDEIMERDLTTGYGAVDYVYRISTHEVSNSQYAEFLNDVAADDPFSLYCPSMGSSTRGGIVRTGSPGNYSYDVKPDAEGKGPHGSDYAYASKPVAFVSWYDAIRFCNWLSTGTTESGPYTITEGGPDSGTVTLPDHGSLGTGNYLLPTEDEWYKAAYYDSTAHGGAGGYYDYPTGTDELPDNNLPSADTGNSVNYLGADYTTGDRYYPMTDVGAYALSASPYGTYDQAGNLWEWNESLISSSRGLRGGSWDFNLNHIRACDRFWHDPTWHDSGFGFRITSPSPIPEPCTLVGLISMGITGALAYVSWRRRRAA